jgi:hypothetical protein
MLIPYAKMNHNVHYPIEILADSATIGEDGNILERSKQIQIANIAFINQ